MTVLAVVWWIVKILLIFVGCVVALVLVAAAVPIRGTVSSAGPGTPLRLRLEWLFGIVRVTAYDSSGDHRRSKRRRKDKKQKPKRTQRTASSHFSIPEEPTAIVARIVRYLRELRGAVTYSGAGTIVFGLPDPADTGILFGRIVPLSVWSERALGVSVLPTYTGAVFGFSGRITLGFVPIRVVPPTVAFVLSAEGRRLLRAIRRSGGKKADRRENTNRKGGTEAGERGNSRERGGVKESTS